MAAIRMSSPYPPVMLAERLKAALPETMTSGSAQQVTGYGTEARMTLWSHRPNFRNSFKSVLSATVEPQGSGSVIEGRMGMHFATRLFLMFWMSLVGLFGIGALATILIAGIPLFVAFPMAAVPVAMLAFGCALLLFGRRTARSDEAKILSFLNEAVDAQPMGDAGGAQA